MTTAWTTYRLMQRLVAVLPASLMTLMIAGAAATAATAQAQPQAQPYPSRPIELIQGFGVGGNADTVARLIGARLQTALGQSVVVEAKTGAGGNLASGLVAKARPDGHTLILLTGGHAVSAAYYRTLAFKPVDDFDMISTVCFFPFVIAVRPDHPARSLKDLFDMARAKPDSITFSSVGVGSTQHLTGELLGVTAGARLLHVPYRGGAAPIQGVIGGEVDLLVDSMTVAGPQIEAGRLRPLAVTSAAAWPSLPGVPTVAATLPGFQVRSWLGLAAPRGLPAEVRQRLHTEMVKILAVPEVRQQLARLGADAQASTPEQMRSMIESEIARWRAVIVRSNLAQQ